MRHPLASPPPRPRVRPRAAANAAAAVATLLMLGASPARSAPAVAPEAAGAPVEIDPFTFGGLAARPIGPAVTGGRIAAIEGVAGEPLTLYVGAAGGGVWRSRDGGTTWKPVFDDQIQSIGAIAADPGNPRTVWVGTGESWTRNSVSVGDGVYKSTDGGDHWDRMGLEDSERIARIQVSPADGNTVWVCATGHLWSAGGQRGVYKTSDGGKTWKRVLFVDDATGCSDLAVDPQEPSILYAGMWQFRRYPWAFSSGGPGSGLWKSTDGGETWRQLKRGLPAGDKGRIAVAVAPSRPSVVYAVVEARKTALYRSDDTGESWAEINDSFNVQARPFYFARLVVDPGDFKVVYKPGLSLSLSLDGGKSFTSPFSGSGPGAGPHSDHHAVWVNPRATHQVVLGTDGGVYISQDRAHTWRFVKALPVGQFYEVSFDMRRPYNVYGGLQDNGSWMAPSRGISGVQNKDWRNIGSGDGFYAWSDPADSGVGYVEYQGGHLSRVDFATGESKDIRPLPAAGDPELRFNWNTPVALSPSHPGTIYLGAQFLYRSHDRGESWERISPDLTTNDPVRQRQRTSGGLTVDNSSAENYTTIYAVAESPLDPRVVWVGTDDGNVQITRDGGKSWSSVARVVAGLPPGALVSRIEPGHRSAATAFVTFDNHANGDMATYVYKTGDFGQTWTSLAGKGASGYAHVIREDPENPDLFFLGTELGLFISVDGGRQWARFTGSFPKVAVRDLAIHPRESDLVIATHGRGIYILDDITPLRKLARDLLEQEVVMLPSRDAVLQVPAAIQDFPGDDEFSGANPDEAAMITYYLKKRHVFGDLKVEVYDSAGKLISSLPGGRRRGINRVAWPMRLKPPKLPAANSLIEQPFSFLGPWVAAGTYTVKLVKADQTFTGQVRLVPDPRSQASDADRALQHETVLKLYDMLGSLTYLADAAADAGAQARRRAAPLPPHDRLRQQLEKLSESLEKLRGTLAALGEGWLSGEEQLREKLGTLYGAVNGYEGRPTRSQLDQIPVLDAQLDDRARRLKELEDGPLAAANRALAAAKLQPITLLTRAAWDQKQEKEGTGGGTGMLARPGALVPLPLGGGVVRVGAGD